MQPLQSESIGSVVAKETAVANVAAHGGEAAMPGLVHDGALGLPGGSRRGGEPSLQAMSGEVLPVDRLIFNG